MAEIHFVWAEDLDGWIGKDNALPWHCPADMRHFRQLTTASPIVMGKKTFDSIGRPLPKRQNIVLSHQPLSLEGVIVVHSIAELQRLFAQLAQPIYVIGGAGVFKQLLAEVTVLDRTIINGHYHGDVKMPPVDYSRWHLVERRPVNDGQTTVCWFETWHLDVKKN